MTEGGDRVVVVGGGVIGAACAHYLLEQGFAVTVVEQGAFGSGCSRANCGFICPSHVLPLAGPGALRAALAALLRPGAPFSIRPRLDVELWRWLIAFRKRCNKPAMLSAGKAIQSLLDSSRRLYDELFDRRLLDAEHQRRGLLFVLKSPKAMEHFAAVDRLTREEFGVAARRLESDALVGFEPALVEGLAGGWHYEGDSHLRPDRLLTSWRRSLEQQKAVILEQTAMLGLESRGRRARGVETSGGTIPAAAVVVAAGAWTPQLSRSLGRRLPIQPGKGYSLTMQRPAICPTTPLLFEEHRVAVTPMESGFRLGSIMEFSGYDDSLPLRKLQLLRDGAKHYLREPLGAGEQAPWCGWRPMTPDSLPIIGRMPGWENVFVAAGHNMLGVSMAPATGKLIAELVAGEPSHLDPTPYSAERF